MGSRLYVESTANTQGLWAARGLKPFEGGVSPLSLGIFSFIVTAIAVGMIVRTFRRSDSDSDAESAVEESDVVEDGLE